MIIVQIIPASISCRDEVDQQPWIAEATQCQSRQQSAVQAMALSIPYDVERAAIALFSNVRQLVEVALDRNGTVQ